MERSVKGALLLNFDDEGWGKGGLVPRNVPGPAFDHFALVVFNFGGAL